MGKPGTNFPAQRGARAVTLTEEYSLTRSAPLPPPEEFARYNDGVPNAAERILRMAEIEQERRLAREDRKQAHAERYDMAGVRIGGSLIGIGMLLAVLVFGFFGWLALQFVAKGEDLYGLASLVAAIGGAAFVFFKWRPNTAGKGK